VSIMIFSCGGPKPPPCSVPGCGNPQWTHCVFELRGARAGEVCGRPLCSAHGGDGALCPPHYRFMAEGGRPGGVAR